MTIAELLSKLRDIYNYAPDIKIKCKIGNNLLNIQDIVLMCDNNVTSVFLDIEEY